MRKKNKTKQKKKQGRTGKFGKVVFPSFSRNAVDCTMTCRCSQLDLWPRISPWSSALPLHPHGLMNFPVDNCSDALMNTLQYCFYVCSPWSVSKQPVHLTQAATTDSPQSFIHGTPSVEVTHISLYFKLNVRCKALPKHVGLSTQHVSESPVPWKANMYTFLHKSLSSQSLASPLQVIRLDVERQGDFKVGLCPRLPCRITPESQWF